MLQHLKCLLLLTVRELRVKKISFWMFWGFQLFNLKESLPRVQSSHWLQSWLEAWHCLDSNMSCAADDLVIYDQMISDDMR